MFVIKHRAKFLWISVALVTLSLVLLAKFGLNLGIDFIGGSLTEVSYNTEAPLISELEVSLNDAGFDNVLLQATSDNGFFVKTKDLTTEEHTKLLSVLSNNGLVPMEEVQFTSIGPSVGRELQNKAVIALSIVSLAIVFFIAYAFRKVSKPVRSWKYGLIAVIALIHDVILTTGVFVLLGRFASVEIDTLFVVALLTVLGLSVNDTIVVFDRIRENLQKDKNKSFADIVGKSLSETYARSINTTLSIIIMLLALVFVGPSSTKYFAIALTFGMFFGAYSSICLASPLLVKFFEWQEKKKTNS